MHDSNHVIGSYLSLSLFLLNHFPWLEIDPQTPAAHACYHGSSSGWGYLHLTLLLISPALAFFLNVDQTLTLTSHYRYAAVLVVFLGNFNPSTLTG